MAIALATLSTNIYSTFYNHFATGTYALTCISSSNQLTPVYSDNISIEHGFPVIEIGTPIVSDVHTDRFGNVQQCSCVLPILIAEDNAIDSKTSMDNVRNMILTGKSVFKTVGLTKIRILGGDTNLVNKNKKNYHFTRVSVNFDYRERL